MTAGIAGHTDSSSHVSWCNQDPFPPFALILSGAVVKLSGSIASFCSHVGSNKKKKKQFWRVLLKQRVNSWAVFFFLFFFLLQPKQRPVHRTAVGLSAMTSARPSAKKTLCRFPPFGSPLWDEQTAEGLRDAETPNPLAPIPILSHTRGRRAAFSGKGLPHPAAHCTADPAGQPAGRPIPPSLPPRIPPDHVSQCSGCDMAHPQLAHTHFCQGRAGDGRGGRKEGASERGRE